MAKLNALQKVQWLVDDAIVAINGGHEAIVAIDVADEAASAMLAVATFWVGQYTD